MYYLSHLQNIGFTSRDLFRIFPSRGDYRQFFEDFTSSRLETFGIKSDRIQNILSSRERYDVQKSESILFEYGVRLASFYDVEYPESLRHIASPPFFISVRGELKSMSLPLAIVGSRKHSPYSRDILRTIIPSLVSSGVSIISGGAYGVDSLAHSLALEHGGYTISVVGTGIDKCYPPSNRHLFDDIIAKGGAIISQFPLGAGPEQYHFPQRNEIISGLSRGVIVTEAGEKSGTLITARLALEQGRDVFVFPGSIFTPYSNGAHMLIKMGSAKLVTHAGDILEEYSIHTPIHLQSEVIFASEEEARIFSLLGIGDRTADAISASIHIPISTTLSCLAMMEVNGLVEMTNGGSYKLRR